MKDILTTALGMVIFHGAGLHAVSSLVCLVCCVLWLCSPVMLDRGCCVLHGSKLGSWGLLHLRTLIPYPSSATPTSLLLACTLQTSSTQRSTSVASCWGWRVQSPIRRFRTSRAVRQQHAAPRCVGSLEGGAASISFHLPLACSPAPGSQRHHVDMPLLVPFAWPQARESPPNSLLPQRHTARTGGGSSSGEEQQPLTAGSAFAVLTSGTLSPRKGGSDPSLSRL